MEILTRRPRPRAEVVLGRPDEDRQLGLQAGRMTTARTGRKGKLPPVCENSSSIRRADLPIANVPDRPTRPVQKGIPQDWKQRDAMVSAIRRTHFRTIQTNTGIRMGTGWATTSTLTQTTMGYLIFLMIIQKITHCMDV